MKIDILTIFPDMFAGPMTCSLIAKAREKNILDFRCKDTNCLAQANFYRKTDEFKLKREETTTQQKAKKKKVTIKKNIFKKKAVPQETAFFKCAKIISLLLYSALPAF